MTVFQFVPKDFDESLETSLGSRFFEVGSSIILRRLTMLELMDLLVNLLYTAMESRRSK